MLEGPAHRYIDATRESINNPCPSSTIILITLPVLSGFSTKIENIIMIYQFTGMTNDLPQSIHLLTLQSMGSGTYLLRLEHMFEIGEEPWNSPVNLTLSVSVLKIRLACVFVRHNVMVKIRA